MGIPRWGRRLALVLAVVCLLTACASAAGSAVHVTVLGKEVVWTDAEPFLREGRTMVPMRACAGAMGLEVQWDPASRRVDFSKSYTAQSSIYQAELDTGKKEFIQSRTVSMWIGRSEYTIRNQYAVYDGKSATLGRTYTRTAQMDTAPVLQDNRTYAPIRYVAEQFGYDVIWEAASRTVRLVSEQSVDWNYAWSIVEAGDGQEGSLVLAIHTGSNLTSAEITAVNVRCTEGSPSDGAQQLGAASESDRQRIYDTVGQGVTLLDAVRATYPFQKGSTYTLQFELTVTKANGATAKASEQFQVDLR